MFFDGVWKKTALGPMSPEAPAGMQNAVKPIAASSKRRIARTGPTALGS